MHQFVNPARWCPECGSKDYVFRGRKKIKADPGKETPPGVETKYICRACGNEWKERVAPS
jgi:DNA-directed RNA polymerase subunit M/transcription elongation factor TFIIS